MNRREQTGWMSRLHRWRVSAGGAAWLLSGWLFGLVLLLMCSGCELPVRTFSLPPVGEVATASATPIPATLTLPLPTVTPPPPTTTPTPSPRPTDSPIPTKTLTPSETVTITPGTPGTPTRTPSRTRRPTETYTPLPTRTPTYTPTVTNTPTPPPARVRINKPGWMSKVLSPIRLEGAIIPGDDGLLHIDLVGEDARLITSQRLDYRYSLGRRILISPKIDFSISAVAETSRLVLYTEDKFTRKIALSSVDLILLSVGDNEINPPLSLQEPYLIRSPKAEQVISGGKLMLVGLARPVNDTPLLVELIDEQNRLLGSEKLQVRFPSGDLSHTPFTLEVPYTVSESTPARLSIRQESNGRIPGTVALASLLVTLEP